MTGVGGLARRIHAIGAGGVGVAGVAQVAADLGLCVSGSDAVESAMLAGLRRRGLDVWAPHRNAVPEGTELVVYSSAIGQDNAELADARARGIPCMRRGEYLGQLARHFKTVVAVAGSHGKTSTTAMLAHICKCAGMDPGYIVGGAVTGWERSATAGRGEVLVTEVDESDGTQVFTHATLGLVVNVEDDHCWGHGGVANLEACFVEFMANASEGMAWRTDTTQRLFGGMEAVRFLGEADIPADLRLPLPGRHWRVNGTLAVAAAERLGVGRTAALEALASFPGVERRMTFRGMTSDGMGTVTEDYAHHPTELRATLAALGEAYPGRPLLVVFQPHRFERVKRYGAEFSRILDGAEHSWIVAPFAAWVQDGDGASPESIASAMAAGKGEYAANNPEAIAASVLAHGRALGKAYAVAVIGAGDVARVVPCLTRAGGKRAIGGENA